MTDFQDNIEVSDSDKSGFTIDQWRELSKTGARVAVHINPKGVSMLPLIVQGRDSVVVYPLNRPLKKGDIVLFKRSDGANVMHRVWKIDGERITTLGDGCLRPDRTMDESAVMGIAVTLNRKGKTYCVDSKWSRFQGKVWWSLKPVRWLIKLPRRVAHKVIRQWLGIKGKD